MMAGGIAVLGSLLLPWKRVDLEELFGADIPSLTFLGLSTGIGKVAGLLALGSVAAGVVYLIVAPGRRLLLGLMGLGGAVGAGFVTLIGLFGSPGPGLLLGMGGAVLSIAGGVLATAAAARIRER